MTLLDAAFVRWPIPVAWWDLRVAQMCCSLLLLLLVGYDLWSTGKVYRVTVWASLLLIVLQQLRMPIGRTAHLAGFRYMGPESHPFFRLSAETSSSPLSVKRRKAPRAVG